MLLRGTSNSEKITEQTKISVSPWTSNKVGDTK